MSSDGSIREVDAFASDYVKIICSYIQAHKYY